MLQAQKVTLFGRSLPVYSTIGSVPPPPKLESVSEVTIELCDMGLHFRDQEERIEDFGEGKRVPYKAI